MRRIVLWLFQSITRPSLHNCEKVKYVVFSSPGSLNMTSGDGCSQESGKSILNGSCFGIKLCKVEFIYSSVCGPEHKILVPVTFSSCISLASNMSFAYRYNSRSMRVIRSIFFFMRKLNRLTS